MILCPRDFFFLRFYLFIHERHRDREAETQAEGEADVPRSREPNAGLDLRDHDLS